MVVTQGSCISWLMIFMVRAFNKYVSLWKASSVKMQVRRILLGDSCVWHVKDISIKLVLWHPDGKQKKEAKD